MADEKIVHCMRDKFDVYIGRPSKWGNPFTIGVHGTRAECIEKYRNYLKHTDLWMDLGSLYDKTLGCWCRPKDCHGDVLIEELKKFTCYDCLISRRCKWAFDPYNIGGDCLAAK
jgi:hypothetical protein